MEGRITQQDTAGDIKTEYIIKTSLSMTTETLADLYTPNHIRTYSGRYLNPLDPNPDDIVIEDIAHALSHLCRFGGHTKHFYSVAEHSVAVALSLPPEHRLAGLLHDASEAYLLDIPAPVKAQIPGYKEAEDRLMRVIGEKFGFTIGEEVKRADKGALEREWQYFVLNPREGDSPKSAKARFMRLFNQLSL